MRLIFYSAWLLLAGIHAASTTLIPDEAYYWMYSRQLAWGYFDHPPVIAVMIKMGYFLFQSELGVRLLSILMLGGTVYMIELLTRPGRLVEYYLSLSSLALLHFLGILAVPDVPLMLFTATFLLLYREFTARNSLFSAALLAVNIALMLLSKYHGILIVLFSLCSQPSLLRRRYTWLIICLSAALFLPHVIWQWQHDFPSIRYHLSGRNHLGYTIEQTLTYLLYIPLIFAPGAGLAVVYYSLRYPPKTAFEKALKWNLTGIFLFFLIMSFRGRVEANWIVPAIIPAFSLGYPRLEEKRRPARFINISYAIVIPVIVLARILTMDSVALLKSDLNGWKSWAKLVEEEAGDKPVAFVNSYQKASEYTFYTGKPAFSLNNVMGGRKDQFHIWGIENALQGAEILLVSNYYAVEFQTKQSTKGEMFYTSIDNFRSSTNILVMPLEKEASVNSRDSFTIHYKLVVAKGSSVDAEANSSLPMQLCYLYFEKGKFISFQKTSTVICNDMLKSGETFTLRVAAPENKGNYTLHLCIATGFLPPTDNGAKLLIHSR